MGYTNQPVSGPLTDAELRASPIPVSISGGSSSGGLTDTELRASPVPVSGTVGVSGTIPVSGPITDTQLRASAVPVSVSNFPATQPVSGAVSISGTAAVSGPLTDTQLRASAVPVSGTVTATGPLTDTQLRASAVPVSGTVSVANFPSTQAVSGTVAVTPPSLTKGTQGATGFTVQNLKDSGRTNVSLYAEAVAGATTEALITLNQSKGFAAATTGSSYTVTAGKTLRLTAISIAFVSTTTTANTARVRIRVNTGGAAALSSPICFDIRVGWPSATFIANEGANFFADFPDGIEIPAGSGVGITHQEAAANGTLDVSLVGFEY